jgi:uncharacterized membrane protein
VDPISLERRVERLERMVEDLHRAVLAGSATAAAPPAESPPSAREVAHAAAPRDPAPVAAAPAALTASQAPRSSSAPAWGERIWDGEFWLNKLGMGLVLFGVTFLFKYSVDQGWLTPTVRVAIGAALGTLLLLAGLRLGEAQRSLAQVLKGGGIATFYVVGFAAFQLYSLVGYTAAFAFMVAVTVAAFALAVRDDHPMLSLIGVKGALGTPFLLYSGAGDFAWLVGYTCLVVASGVALCLSRGWRSVLWTAAAGGWSVLGIAYATGIAGLARGDATGERWILQGAVLFFWLTLALVVPGWEVRHGALAGGGATAPLEPSRGRPWHFHLLVVSTPLLAACFTGLAWAMSGTAWGWSAIALATLYLGAAAALRAPFRELSDAHWLAAALLLPLATVAAASAYWVYPLLAVQAAAMHGVTRRLGVASLAAVGHGIFAACAVWFLIRLDQAGIAGNWRATADLAVIGAAVVASLQLASARAVRIYLFAVHGAVLAWLWRELAPLAAGAALVSTAWGAYGLALLVFALRRRVELLQKTAIATLLLMVAKLFVVDLAALEAIWRILLFLGLGGLFLTISYLLRGVWDARRPVVGR